MKKTATIKKKKVLVDVEASSDKHKKEKFDLKKDQKHLYAPSDKEGTLVEVPDMNFLAADGDGDPIASPNFQAAVEALYGLS
jgi:hypothetical protein